MNLRRLFIIGTVACLVLLSAYSQADWWSFTKNGDSKKQAEELTEITWKDLIPADFVQPENPLINMPDDEIAKLMDGSEESNAKLERLQAAFNHAPVVDSLDGKRVKIAAYVTPLEFDGQTKMSEFLLVPYVGACMHTPPPPANQVVHAESDEAVQIKSMYDAVWAIGTISTETVKSDLAVSGYHIQIEEVLPYSR